MTELERRANEMRSDIVRMIAEAGSVGVSAYPLR